MKALHLLFAILTLFAGCSDSPQREMQVGGVAVRVEVADTPQSRRQGLMHRESLGENDGMLLAFPRPRILQIWMLNTPIALDVGFFDAEGVMLNTHSMVPDGGRKIYESTGPALYALEMNRGWFAKHGIGPGAILQLPPGIIGR